MRTIPYPEEVRTDGTGDPGPRLVIAMSCVDPMGRANPALPCSIDLSGVREVRIGRADEHGFDVVRGRFASMIILTIRIPDIHLSTDHMTLSRESEKSPHFRACDVGSTNGTWRNGERIDEVRVADRDVLAIGMTILVFREAGVAPRMLEAAATTDDALASPDELRTFNPEFSAVITTMRRLASSELSMIVCGETGVGKEVMARAIHRLSGRRGPFVAINCGAVPPGLSSPELFGVERGAYTGADKNRAGVVRSADQGTLLLDEIAEMPLDTQAVLLRVLEEKRVTPVGGSRSVAVDVRFIAATHQDLGERVASGAFRQDLLARLCGYVLTVPPLRERCEDIGLLLARLLPEVAAERAPDIQFGRQAASRLFQYHWPDNVRELRRTLEAATLLAPDGVIRLAHLPAHLVESSAGVNAATESPPGARARARSRGRTGYPAAKERELRDLLAHHHGNLSAVARAMKTSPSHIRRLLERYGIERG